MCVHIFSPGCKLHIDYASESITVTDGGREDLLDLLLTNHSEQSTDRFHIVYPHPVSWEATSGEQNLDSLGFFDLTGTWLEPDSPHNDFYETEDVETRREITGDDGKGVMLTISMINPYDITQQEPYKGYVRGGWELTRFDPGGAAAPVTEREWEWLEELSWSVFTVKLTAPLEKNEARWFRFLGRTGTLPGNTFKWTERWYRKLTGTMVHDFEPGFPFWPWHGHSIHLRCPEYPSFRVEPCTSAPAPGPKARPSALGQ